MKTIESFTVDHLKLGAGLYVSRRDHHDATGCDATTFDLRMIRPYEEPFLDMAAIHTVEHLCATYLRNSERGKDIVYFGPMGCRTGFYLVMFGHLESEDVYDLIVGMCDFVLAFEGEVPGVSKAQCGNYLAHDLVGAKSMIAHYKEELTAHKRFRYS